ncbi:uncharacterized protein BP5553_02972 [Venustampulla echinocandica]|uniref:Yeast cell wall synthesis Kre9/Knh1-like N-terminal domain-containing protein n=1 Tax=Venustampulla echinocandica TaxID=2656787 RepID=A0A370TSX8_9HELO|nr:uncharacterized protein BP5553_02972 [Venustampulla echinocandica]RDL38632.1 hypothetical protein BP5553_02972 [Venustampulla echinocandica]
MRYSIISAALLSMSTLATATGRIMSPQAGESWVIGKEQTIMWDTSAMTGPIDANLVPAGAQDTTIIIAKIATQVENKGSLKWTPDKSIAAQQVTIIIIDSKQTNVNSDIFVLVLDENSSKKNSDGKKNNNGKYSEGKKDDNEKNYDGMKYDDGKDSEGMKKGMGKGKSNSTETAYENKTTKKTKKVHATSTEDQNSQTMGMEGMKSMGNDKTSQMVASTTEMVQISTTALAEASPTMVAMPQVAVGNTMSTTLANPTVEVLSPTKAAPTNAAITQISEEPTTTIAVNVAFTTAARFTNSSNFLQASGTGAGVQPQFFSSGASSTLLSTIFTTAAGGVLGLLSVLFL